MTKNSFTKEQDATVLDFDAVYERVKAIAIQEENFNPEFEKDMSKALTLFYLQSNFQDLDNFSAMGCIVDGRNDQGIDAIYIEETSTGNTVHIVQTKFVMKREKALETRFPGNELVKFIKKFDDFIVNNKHHEFANSSLQLKLNEIYALEQKTFNIILLTTGIPPASQELTQFLDSVSKYNKRKKYVDAEFVGLGDLADLLPSVIDPKVNIKLKFEGNIVETKSGRVQNIVIGRVQGRAIAELVRSEGDQLFAKNVRGFLKTKNTINSEILNTATDPEEAPYFFVLNNGITIVCDDTDYMSGMPSPEVLASGAQIVNGGQTSNTLFEALKTDKLQPSVEVLVRIIETKKKDVLDKITKATNSQTSVSNRDLRSNDSIQKTIEQYMEDKYSHYYESRRNKYLGKKPTKTRVDIEIATQSYYAYKFLKPDFAKSSKSALFSTEVYNDIFNNEEGFSIDTYFFSYKLRRALESLRPQFIGRYLFLRDAEITSLALLAKYSGIKSYDDLQKDEDNSFTQLKKDYRKILEATQEVVDEEVAEKGEAFEKRRFFIAPSTYGRIQEEMVLSSKKA